MKKPIPYDFILEELAPLNPFIRPMFGAHALYVRDKIMLIIRKRPTYLNDNGIWLATTIEHHASLKNEFPKMRSISVLGSEITAWQNIPEDSDDFEESAFKVCQLIIDGDLRIGKIPKSKTKNNAKKTAKKNGNGAKKVKAKVKSNTKNKAKFASNSKVKAKPKAKIKTI